jgi:hypothetical protein
MYILAKTGTCIASQGLIDVHRGHAILIIHLLHRRYPTPRQLSLASYALSSYGAWVLPPLVTAVIGFSISGNGPVDG